MNILIYEHASAGGFAEGAVSPEILAEGFGMLRTFVADLNAAGHHVTIVISAELAGLNPPLHADCMLPVFSFQEAQQVILKASAVADAAFIIAPETGGTLRSMVEFLEQNGVATINCSSKSIEAVSDKGVLFQVLKCKGLLVPKTVTVDVSDSIGKAVKNCFSFPVVFKPLDGVGCSGLSLVENESQIVEAVAKLDSELVCRKFVVQEFIEGEAVSVSMLCTGSSVLPVNLNKQEIFLSNPTGASCYMGGAVPLEHKLREKAFEVAKAVVGCFSGLRGYVGIDLILTKDDVFVVDVNPRLTTSFVGLSRVAGFIIADSIVKAALNGELPTSVPVNGYCVFSKVVTTRPDNEDMKRSYSMPGVISPPFPVLDCDYSCALVSGEGKTIDIAHKFLEEAKKNMLDSV